MARVRALLRRSRHERSAELLTAGAMIVANGRTWATIGGKRRLPSPLQGAGAGRGAPVGRGARVGITTYTGRRQLQFTVP
jgi:hypothetical protein